MLISLYIMSLMLIQTQWLCMNKRANNNMFCLLHSINIEQTLLLLTKTAAAPLKSEQLRLEWLYGEFNIKEKAMRVMSINNRLKTWGCRSKAAWKTIDINRLIHFYKKNGVESESLTCSENALHLFVEYPVWWLLIEFYEETCM